MMLILWIILGVLTGFFVTGAAETPPLRQGPLRRHRLAQVGHAVAHRGDRIGKLSFTSFANGSRDDAVVAVGVRAAKLLDVAEAVAVGRRARDGRRACRRS